MLGLIKTLKSRSRPPSLILKPAGSRIFSKSQIYHSLPLALDLPLAKLQNAGSMQMCGLIWLVCTFIVYKQALHCQSNWAKQTT